MRPRVVAVVQARLGSTRLPGKALLALGGGPMLAHVLARAAAVPGVDQVVLATTVRPEDAALAEVARAAGIACVRGSVDDVLDRVHAALAAHPADAVVRITADCPLLDPEVSGRVVSEYRRRPGELDYVSNVHPPTYPDGLDTEVIAAPALERAWREASPGSDREHVTPYVWSRPERFRLANVGGAEDLSGHRWTVDDARDLAFVREVYRRLAPPRAAAPGPFGTCAMPLGMGAMPFGMGAVLDLLRACPEIAQLNAGTRRNAGFERSRLAERAAAKGHGRVTGPSFDRSMEWLSRARRVVPGTSQTLSKGPAMFVEGAYPVFLERGRGSHVWDVDGNEYVDYILGLASITLGYAYPAITEAVACQLERGSIFSLPHPLEVEVSERLTEIIPCAEMVRFLKTGSEADAAAVRVARAATGREVVLVCYDQDTEILTEEGFRRIYALRLGDRVATLNPPTGLIEYQPILRLTSRHYRGDLVHFHGKRVDLMVTPDHHIYREFRDRAGRASFRLVEAKTALERRGPLTMTAGAGWIGSSCEVIRIPSARVTRQTHRRDRGRGWRTKGLTEFDPRLFLRFLGYYLTEGWCQKAKRPRYEINLAQRAGASRDRMVETIRALGFKPRVSGHHITFASKELWLFLQNCGDGAQLKQVPGWIKALDPALLEELFQAMIDGDGTRNRDGTAKRFYSTSKTLADDVCELALKLGYSATVTWRLNRGFGSRTGGVKSIYHVSLSRDLLRRVLPSDIATVPYDGLVYCVTVPNHLVFARRNGKAVWSGNCGYAGWHEWYAVTTPRSKGIPKDFARLVVPFEYNSLRSLETALTENYGRVAAVIMEPVLLDVPASGFLAGVKAAAHRHGALLIFDEIVSGFRWAVGGAQAHFGVVPDLATFGKGMANGLPLAAVVGPRELMREFEDVFVSSTFGGDTLALAACLATLDVYRREPVIEHLWRMGRRFQDGFGALAARLGVPVRTVGYPVHPKVVIDHRSPEAQRLLMSLFLQETAARGVIFHFAGFNVSYSHTEADVDQTLAACAAALRVIGEALADGRIAERLRGKPYQEAFRRS